MHPAIQQEPVLECDWNAILPFANSTEERLRIQKYNKALLYAPYPLTRDYLNNYYNLTNFYLKQFLPQYDCASAMYTYWHSTYKQTSQTGGGGSKAMQGRRGEGTSYGFNPFFGFDSPLGFGLWAFIIFIGYNVLKK